jgi:hypothetical protein
MTGGGEEGRIFLGRVHRSPGIVTTTAAVELGSIPDEAEASPYADPAAPFGSAKQKLRPTPTGQLQGEVLASPFIA